MRGLPPAQILARALVAMVVTSLSGPALAQSTGSVASPKVNPGASIGFAAAVGLEDGETNFAHRLDYRRTVGDSVRLSAITFYNDRGGNYRLRRFALEAMHQFASTPDERSSAGWSSAVQARVIIPDGNDGATRLRMAWLNRWKPEAGGDFRLIGLATRDFGNDPRPGLSLETRAEATWAVGPEIRVGVQAYNRYNNTVNFGSFKDQRHSLGGVLKGSLTEQVSYRVNAVMGVSEAAADLELRMRFNVTL